MALTLLSLSISFIIDDPSKVLDAIIGARSLAIKCRIGLLFYGNPAKWASIITFLNPFLKTFCMEVMSWIALELGDDVSLGVVIEADYAA